MSHVFNWSQLLQAASEGVGLEQDRGSSSVGSNAWCVHVCRDAGRLEQTDEDACWMDLLMQRFPGWWLVLGPHTGHLKCLWLNFLSSPTLILVC